MRYEIRDNSGSLFKNKRKEKDSQPNATGRAMIGGVMFEVSAWTKIDRNGNPWQSLSFKQADEAARRDHAQSTVDAYRDNQDTSQRRGSLKDQLDDDLPF